MSDKIKISYEDLQNPKIDEVLTQESSFRRGMGSKGDIGETTRVSFIHKSWFYLLLAGLIGALIAWGVTEPYLGDTVEDEQSTAIALLMLLSMGGLVGLMVGSMEGILARNFSRSVKSGLIGLLIGFGGGIASIIIAGIVAQIIIPIGVAIVGAEAAQDPAHNFAGFILIVIVRSLIWTVLGMTVGLGPGIALKAKKLVLNGFIGGMIGGMIGGLLFDPINYFVSGGTMDTGVEISRAIGLGVIGATTGFMIGIVEMLTKDAWLLMTEGPLKGKQFIVYKNPTRIGSSPSCEIYLFKDPSIEPFHANIHIVRDGYLLEDNHSPDGTMVNDQKITNRHLRNGDVIQIGKAKFIYSEKEKKS